jgi:hypothetical protein
MRSAVNEPVRQKCALNRRKSYMRFRTRNVKNALKGRSPGAGVGLPHMGTRDAEGAMYREHMLLTARQFLANNGFSLFRFIWMHQVRPRRFFMSNESAR